MVDKTYTLVDKTTNQSLDLPVIQGTQGPPTVEISSLYKEMGLFTYDPGFMATASCSSAITYIDGEAGVLEYRGYPIEQLAEQSHFLEVTYLLLYGHLPGAGEMEEFEDIITHHTMINKNLLNLFDGFHYNAHPMAIMTGVVGSLSAFYHDSLDIQNPRHREISAHRLIAKMPTIAAACFKHSKGEEFIFPRNELSFAANFLHMMFSTPCEEYIPDPVAVKAIDILFMLHADHEQNASTSTVRLAGSSHANPFACIAAGIASLWGPAHGGANEAVLDMLTKIGDVSQVEKYVLKAKDKDDPFRLMGFGHRVYKHYDPRARIIRQASHEVLKSTGNADSPLMELALALEDIALKDEYFIERKLYPNVDFYSGIIYRALGIPNNMFTVMFAIARSVGWISHWMEMIADPQQRIGRPRQVYTGSPKRDYVPVDKR